MSGAVLLVLRVLLVVLLYAFLGWALYTLWRDLQRQAELRAARQVRPLSLALRRSSRFRKAALPSLR